MKKIIISLAIVLCLSFSVFGEEGMWMLSQVKNLDLEKKGFEISASDIYSPDKASITDAIVLLGGGTSEFVSPNGLLLTNHHVAYGAVQRASTKGTDFITKGFLAKTQADEIEAPGYTAQVLQQMKDVTYEFKKFNKIKDLVKRQKAIDKKIRQMTDKIEKGKTDINARVAEMYNGKQYILYVYKRFDDVRVVYVPPMAIGNYGGDIDNWMWPRHTGDFSFMRVYMAPDGTGRKYHKDNVPYKPKHWLRVAKEGLKKGDQTFIIGFPGTTRRYLTSNAVAEWYHHTYPFRIKYFKEIIDMMQEFAKDSQVAKAKVAGLDKGLNNVMKNYQGNIDGMRKGNFIKKKLAFENQLMEFLKKDKKLFAKYGDVLKKMKEQHELQAKYRELDAMNLLFGRLGGTITGTATGAYFTAKEREKPKKERDPNFSEKDIKRRVARMGFGYMSYYEPADKALLVKALKTAAKLPKELRITELDYILKEDIEKFVDDAYKKTKLKDVNFAKTLFTKKSTELEALNDPFIDMAKNIYPLREEIRKRNEKFDAALDELRKQYINALYAWKGSNLYPDANRTIRFSYGRVAGYQPRDAVYYEPFTFIKGMLEKDTGKEPFDMPEGVKKLYAAKDFGRWTYPGVKDVPIAFTHKVDSTGGNSGSPVINAKGEIVGILFDGNYESMTGDWQYDPAIQRSISVDIRYVMFITEKLAGAKDILKEMQVN
jgi:hypothetical protein